MLKEFKGSVSSYKDERNGFLSLIVGPNGKLFKGRCLIFSASQL